MIRKNAGEYAGLAEAAQKLADITAAGANDLEPSEPIDFVRLLLNFHNHAVVAAQKVENFLMPKLLAEDELVKLVSSEKPLWDEELTELLARLELVPFIAANETAEGGN